MDILCGNSIHHCFTEARLEIAEQVCVTFSCLLPCLALLVCPEKLYSFSYGHRNLLGIRGLKDNLGVSVFTSSCILQSLEWGMMRHEG